MENLSYYLSFAVVGNNVAREDCHLVANCAGTCTMSRPFHTNMPRGRQDFYLQYMTKGEMKVRIDGKWSVMRPGGLIFYAPHTAYEYAYIGGTMQYHWVHFTGYGAGELLQSLGIVCRQMYDAGHSQQLALGFEGLFHDCMRRDPYQELSTSARVLSLCVEIARLLKCGKTAHSPEDDRIGQALSEIHRRYDTSLPVSELSRSVHMSIGRFRTLFRRQTGYAPAEYIAGLRLNRACELLLHTTHSVGEIAEAVGYTDPLYFCRVFRKKRGMSPTAYRKFISEDR